MSLALLVYLAHRISRPSSNSPPGFGKLAAGISNARVQARRDDEIGRAIQAFNHMAGQLQESTERLVYLRQLASWQTLARKMAHEVKNSLTPIRLTVEEMLARYDESDRGFMEQATQIVVDEIETPGAAHPRVLAIRRRAAGAARRRGRQRAAARAHRVPARRRIPKWPTTAGWRRARRRVMADQDLLKGILTNLLENAAEAAGEGGRILGVTASDEGRVAIEVHDSGPGLSEQARVQPVSTHHLLQEAGHGAGAFHRAQERAADRRGHCCW